MLLYWLFFIIPAFAALNKRSRIRRTADGTQSIRISSTSILTILLLTLIVGFRYQVGGDWHNYFRYFDAASYISFSDLVTLDDPGYWALNWISERLGLGMTGVNTLAALIFSTGLTIFCLSLPRPSLALACAMPYLVVVVGMGYTRQAIALGLAMIGLVMLRRGKIFTFAKWVLIGALFHKTAVLLIPIAALTRSKSRLLSLAIVALMAVVGYFVLLQDSVEYFVEAYQDENFVSEGALVRLAMNAVPAALFLLYRNKMVLTRQESELWSLFSYISLAMFFAFFPTNLSTALDRLALYLLPLQLVVFSHLPDALGIHGGRNNTIVTAILLYYSAVFFVWLNFAVHSSYWLPYRIGIA